MIAKNKVYYEDGSHTYYTDEAKTQMVPFYSGIIKEVLGDKFAKIPFDVLEKARIRGSAVHKATQLLDEDKRFTTVYPGHVEQWERFKLDAKIDKFDVIEQPLFSKVMWCGVTPDRVVGDTIIEIKTSSQSYKDYRLQTACQAIAAEENFGIKINKRMLVFLSDSTYKTEIHDNPKDFDYWRGIVKTFQWKMFEK